mmetsp:Transcript_28003/g.39851  ORF Transcript_28003/g.39851 Transcript_28003/m.39851 type:complete len:208 (+) Transcript_28003:28-651(+)
MTSQLPNRGPGKAPTSAGFGIHISERQKLSNESKKQNAPTTHMVVQFRDEFKDGDAAERKMILKGDLNSTTSKSESRHAAASSEISEKLSKYRETVKQQLDESKSPSLASSFLLPKVYPVNQPHGYESNRNMLGRSDVACQNDLNLRKLRLDGLSEYQKWSTDEVEPFLKELRKSIKAQRPTSIEDFCIEFCYARVAGKDPPETKED